jgi:hypothetical protein
MGRGWGHRNGHEKHLVFSQNLFQSGRRVGFTTGCSASSACSTPTAFRCQAIARIVATS